MMMTIFDMNVWARAGHGLQAVTTKWLTDWLTRLLSHYQASRQTSYSDSHKHVAFLFYFQACGYLTTVHCRPLTSTELYYLLTTVR